MLKQAPSIDTSEDHMEDLRLKVNTMIKIQYWYAARKICHLCYQEGYLNMLNSNNQNSTTCPHDAESPEVAS